MPMPLDFDRRRHLQAFGALSLAAVAAPLRAQKPADPPTTSDGGPFVPTPFVILEEMLKLAEVKSTDLVYDLGSGDGRLVIEAAKRYGARGVGVERDANLVTYSRRQAESERVAERVQFHAADIFDTPVRDATVITMYLLPRLMPRLVPKLRDELRPGTRIVSHDYPLTPWRADKTLTFDTEEKIMINGTTLTTLFYYLVPANAGGRWWIQWSGDVPGATGVAAINQRTDGVEGEIVVDQGTASMRDLAIRADSIRFGLLHGGRLMEFYGRIEGDTMSGTIKARTDRGTWTAKRHG